MDVTISYQQEENKIWQLRNNFRSLALFTTLRKLVLDTNF